MPSRPTDNPCEGTKEGPADPGGVFSYQARIPGWSRPRSAAAGRTAGTLRETEVDKVIHGPFSRSLVLDGVAARVAPTRAWEAFGEARGGYPSEPRGYTRAATTRATPKGWGVTCMYVYLTKQRVSKLKPGQLPETSL